MISSGWEAIDGALGLQLSSAELGAGRMALRAFVVFVLSLAMVRVGNRRFMGRSTTFDVVLGIVFGSVVSRAITGTSPFGPTLAAGFVLVLSHRIVAALTYKSHRVGVLLKGRPRLLLERGEFHREEMAASHVTERDVEQAMRAHGLLPVPEAVEAAHLERNGEISIVARFDPVKRDSSQDSSQPIAKRPPRT